MERFFLNCTLLSSSLLLLISVADGFQATTPFIAHAYSRQSSTNSICMAVGIGKGYEPKWKKQKTLAEMEGGVASLDPKKVGLIGNTPVVFRQGNETRTTLALAGTPVSFAAAQAGQPIRYGCKKGECGTCEALCNGKWIRPCVALVPELPAGEEFVLQVKEVKKAKSSGKFFSVRSFIMGFYNNLLGMVGFVKQRRAARKNWQERMEMEELIKSKALEKKLAREQQL